MIYNILTNLHKIISSWNCTKATTQLCVSGQLKVSQLQLDVFAFSYLDLCIGIYVFEYVVCVFVDL